MSAGCGGAALCRLATNPTGQASAPCNFCEGWGLLPLHYDGGLFDEKVCAQQAVVVSKVEDPEEEAEKRSKEKIRFVGHLGLWQQIPEDDDDVYYPKTRHTHRPEPVHALTLMSAGCGGAALCRLATRLSDGSHAIICTGWWATAFALRWRVV